MNLMLITEMQFCRLCRQQVSAITFFAGELTYGFADFLGRSAMTKITETFGRLLISALPVVCCAMAPTVANAQIPFEDEGGNARR